MRTLLFILPLAFCLFACEENIVDTPLEEAITGEWSNMKTSDTLLVLSKVQSLSIEEYGIAFLENGELKEIKNAGWCGTPPISYSEFLGSWDISADSILTIESTYWGGAMTMKWKLIDIDSKKMTYDLLDSYYEDFN